MAISYEWRGAFTSAEANVLHAERFGHAVLRDEGWDWRGRSTGTVSGGCVLGRVRSWSGS
jgi:hypothetical protein